MPSLLLKYSKKNYREAANANYTVSENVTVNTRKAKYLIVIIFTKLSTGMVKTLWIEMSVLFSC